MAVTSLLTRLSVALPIIALFVWLSYLVGIVVYRLYLSPIRQVSRAKACGAHEMVRVLLRGHPERPVYLSHWRLTQQIRHVYAIVIMSYRLMHAGPIVRITPEELHIRDSDYWEELYTTNPKAERYEMFAGRFGNNGSIFTTSSYALHRLCRGVLNPM